MIIKSLLDNDFYKFTMGKIFYENMPPIMVKYKFKCRNQGVIFTQKMVDEIKEEVSHLSTLTFSQSELNYLVPRLPVTFASYLKKIKLEEKYVTISLANHSLEIQVEGPLAITTYFEVPLLAIVNEVYFRNTDEEFMQESRLQEGSKKFCDKIASIPTSYNLSIADFGTRRRYSRGWQQHILELFIKLAKDKLVGTSNVLLAKEYNLQPIGTQAHEYFMVFQQLVPLYKAQSVALNRWFEIYQGKYGIALSDTYGIKAFLKDFDTELAEKYQGVRHDSGDPIDWGNSIIEHYLKHGIDPQSKTLVFSDSLTFPSIINIYKQFSNKAKLVFGVGTNLMNDVNLSPLNIVIKLVEVDGQPVAKISDTPSKGMCESDEFTKFLTYTYR